MLNMFEAIEYKNQESEKFILNLIAPKIPKPLPIKVAYYKSVCGKIVYHITTRD
jgi:hypothetical protein